MWIFSNCIGKYFFVFKKKFGTECRLGRDSNPDPSALKPSECTTTPSTFSSMDKILSGPNFVVLGPNDFPIRVPSWLFRVPIRGSQFFIFRVPKLLLWVPVSRSKNFIRQNLACTKVIVGKF